MTVSSLNNQVSYTGDGLNTTFAFTFKFFEATDLYVYVSGVLKILNIDYTIPGTPPMTGGSVVFTLPPANLTTILIVRILPLTQLTDYVEGDPFTAETHENALDRLTMIAQQLNAAIGAGSESGVVAHGALTGLAADDHLQYALLTGRTGGQTIYGGTVASNDLILSSTSFATKGKIYFGGNSVYDEVNYLLGIGTTTPMATLDLGSGGGFKQYVYNGGVGNRSGFGVDSMGNIYEFAINFAYGTTDQGRLTINSYDGTTFRNKITVLGNGNVGIATGTLAPGELLSLGKDGTTKGVLSLAGNTSGKIIIQPANIAGLWTFTLPITGGTNGYFLQTDGTGITTWAAVAAGVTDHGALTGLADDDHAAYLLASDATSRASFASNWTDLTDAGATTLHSHAAGNLSGVITSVGLATSIASQTGTGTKFVVDTSPTLVTPILGVAAMTSINKMAVTAPTTAATLAFGTDNATITFQGTDTYVGRATTDTLTNKRITARITTITSHATPTINTDNCDAVTITALAEAITSMTTNLSGTPTNFQKLIVRIKDDGTARAISWGASFIARGVALPTTTVISKLLTVGFIYNTVTSVWGCVASAQEA